MPLVEIQDLMESVQVRECNNSSILCGPLVPLQEHYEKFFSSTVTSLYLEI